MTSVLFLILSLISLTDGNFCTEGVTAGWSDTEREELAEGYNTIHTKVFKEVFEAAFMNRPQSNMIPQANYDCALESSAQISANSCPAGYHGSQSPHVADHIYRVWSTKPISFVGQGNEAIDGWLINLQRLHKEDYLNFNKTGSTPDNNFEISWWLGTRIGCAYSRCPSRLDGPIYENIVVCHVII